MERTVNFVLVGKPFGFARDCDFVLVGQPYLAD